jgi:hypothetical protein
MLQWIRLQEKFFVTKHEDNKVHCVFNGINYIKSIDAKFAKNIDAKFAQNISTIYKNSDAFYQKYYCILRIKHTKLMHQTKFYKVVEATYSTKCSLLE